MGDVDVLALRYGQKLRLCAPSAYVKDASSSPPSSSSSSSSAAPPALAPDLGIGYYEKQGRHGILSAVPPLGNDLDVLFNEDEYLVLDPQNLRAPGDIVEFGHTVVLVNQHGMVWNNKTGGITGYVGPRPRGIPGEMFVSFRRGNSKDVPPPAKDKEHRRTGSRTMPTIPALDRDVSTASTTSLSSSSSALDATSFPADGPVHFGDTNVAITVIESNRHSHMYNKRLTNFKKPTSQIVGGYICCDGKGAELRFTLRPAKPKVDQIAMLNKLITAYNYGQKIALPMGILLDKDHHAKKVRGLQHAEIVFKLSNQTTATLPGEMLHEKILRHASHGNDGVAETAFALPLSNGPGELVVKLTGVVPKRALATLIAASHRGPHALSLQAAAIPAARALPPQVTLLQRLGALARALPVPAFALLYALLTHFLWRAYASPVLTHVATAVLVLVPALYVAARADHALTASLFHAPARDQRDAAAAANNDNDDDETHANVSLKLVITEYRFAPGSCSETPALSSTNGSMAQALVAPGSTGALPLRFLKAEKGDETKGRERYMATLAWRHEHALDTILSRAWPPFRTIKTHYPHYYHKRGNDGEPVYYEKPGRIDLKALKKAGVTLADLMHNYLMVTEFLWQVLEPDDTKKCISVLDVAGIGLSDFAGEAVEYVRNAAAVSGGHYPERCAYIFVINVPSWFSMVWNVVKTMMDDVTRDKVIILRGNKQKIFEALAEKIPAENIPEEYGGASEGMAQEEALLYNLMAFLNEESGAKTNPIDAYRREQAMLRDKAKTESTVAASAASGSETQASV